LEVSCPGGEVCDENYLYRAYSFYDEGLRFYISFGQSIVNNYSLEAFKANFNYVDFTIRYPEMATDSSEFYFSSLDIIRKLDEEAANGFKFTIDSFENGRLKGTLKGTVTEITELVTSNAPDCVIGDIQGECNQEQDANLQFSMNYDFCID
jgi:hypothetical protein